MATDMALEIEDIDVVQSTAARMIAYLTFGVCVAYCRDSHSRRLLPPHRRRFSYHELRCERLT
jgi:hypothetical protein